MIFAFLVSLAFSWWSGPHEMVARVSWNDLTDRQRRVIQEIMNSWLDEKTIFTLSGSWLDEIASNSRGSDQITSFKPWHFIDIPLIDNCPGFTEKDTPFVYNITTALTHLIDSFLDPTTTSKWAINFDIRMLLHLVADVHTPVHCVDRYTMQNGVPKADYGGNNFPISTPGNYKISKLHYLWDSAVFAYPSDSFSEEMVQKLIFEFMDKIPSDSEVQNLNVTKWALHSHDIAVKYAYNTTEGSYITPDSDYAKAGQPQAKAQIILAAKRMSYIISRFVQNWDRLKTNDLKSDLPTTVYPDRSTFILKFYTSEAAQYTLIAVDVAFTTVTSVYLMLACICPVKRNKFAHIKQTEAASSLLQSLI